MVGAFLLANNDSLIVDGCLCRLVTDRTDGETSRQNETGTLRAVNNNTATERARDTQNGADTLGERLGGRARLTDTNIIQLGGGPSQTNRH